MDVKSQTSNQPEVVVVRMPPPVIEPDLHGKLAGMKSAGTEQLCDVSAWKRGFSREKEKCARHACGDFGRECSVAKL